MKCAKCGSENVSIQLVNNVKLVNKHHSIWWWLFIGWFWIPIKWLIFTIPALILKIFKSKKKKVINTQIKMAVCQQCGNTWRMYK